MAAEESRGLQGTRRVAALKGRILAFFAHWSGHNPQQLCHCPLPFFPKGTRSSTAFQGPSPRLRGPQSTAPHLHLIVLVPTASNAPALYFCTDSSVRLEHYPPINSQGFLPHLPVFVIISPSSSLLFIPSYVNSKSNKETGMFYLVHSCIPKT